MTDCPRAFRSAPFARKRGAALPVPMRDDVSALSRPEVIDRWDAGVRPAALAMGDATITMFDVIGEDFWSGGGITAKGVAAQLRAIGPKPIELQINSPGGDMFEGIAIYNVLREHPQPITVKVMGLAASAASIVAMAADTLEIGAASFLMIHNCWVVAVGNRLDLAETAAFLEPFDQAMVDVYAAFSGQKPADIAGWMDAETFMNGSQAVERGFADSLLAADQIAEDPAARAAQQPFNAARKLELAVAGKMSRAEARAAIRQIKGTPGAALNPEGTPGAAADTSWLADAGALLATLRS